MKEISSRQSPRKSATESSASTNNAREGRGHIPTDRFLKAGMTLKSSRLREGRSIEAAQSSSSLSSSEVLEVGPSDGNFALQFLGRGVPTLNQI